MMYTYSKCPSYDGQREETEMIKFKRAIAVSMIIMTMTACGQSETASTVQTKSQCETNGHTWVEATCTAPKTCKVCGETDGEAIAHTFTEANYQQPATCSVCGETVGEPLQADFEKYGYVCDAELDTPYSVTFPCGSNENLTSIGTVTFSDYEKFSSDETHEALEGYEWKKITITFTAYDENAIRYGVTSRSYASSYYNTNAEGENYNLGDTYTLNYNGKDYTECIEDREDLQASWDSSRTYTYKVCYFFRCPEGYDGSVAGAAIDENLSPDNAKWIRLN